MNNHVLKQTTKVSETLAVFLYSAIAQLALIQNKRSE
jgi:hypothetical protein